MRDHYTLIRMTEILKFDNSKCWQECSTAETLIFLLLETQKVMATWEESLAVNYKAKYSITI